MSDIDKQPLIKIVPLQCEGEGQPIGFVITGKITQEARDNLRKAWAAIHEGPERGRMVILEDNTNES